MDATTNPSDTVVDLTHCDREPIHILGTVQPFGCLLAVSSDWIVAHASENVSEFIGANCTDMIGRPLADFIAQPALHEIRNRMMSLRHPDAMERIYSIELMTGQPPFDVGMHMSGRKVVIEAEPAAARDLDGINLFRPMMRRLEGTADGGAFFREGARQIRALTNFDRVMVYRFDATGCGEVVAEARTPGVDSYLGLNYPASDIPAQARILYLRSLLRIIADTEAPPVVITPGRDPEGQPLDLSLSVLRAVSPVHIEYLRNMGVRASMSISIILEGKLWGLFACHHYAPILPSFARRGAAELFGQMFSMMLESRERGQARDYEARARQLGDRLLAAIAEDGELLRNAAWLGEVVAESIPCDGIGVFVDNTISLAGLTPAREQCAALLMVLNQSSPSRVFTTDHIGGLLPEAAAYANVAAGLLAIPLSRRPRDYVLLFRSERLRSVRWAGNPEKPAELGPNGARLTPRKSFEAWSQLVQGKALPFTPAELSVAEALRNALLEVILRMSEAVSEERRRAQEKQELLVAELNHRVRNILALIRGLISQTRQSALTSDLFVETLDSRVQALARAHDQITADHWGPAKLADLIETEVGAYLGAKRDRVTLGGPYVMIDPSAFTTLALVVHELTTNAAKYGALSDSGTVGVTWGVDATGDLLLEWRETGGPAVVAPTRQGFGTTIIKRSIPFDLGGTAEIRYRLGGVEADFSVPARYVVSVLDEAVTPSFRPPHEMAAKGLLSGLSVLLVEDSMIVALDGEDALRVIGAQDVYTASNIAQALEAIETGVDFAVLDFNLGRETSLPLANRLLSDGIRFVFATGYGDSLDLPDHLSAIAVLKKPYNAESLARAIAQAHGPAEERAEGPLQA